MGSNIRLAVALAVVVFFWMLSGVFGGSDSEQTKNEDKKNTFTVQVESSEAQEFTVPVQVRAKTEAELDIMLASEIDGAIVATPALEGERVVKGQVICSVNEESRRLRLTQSQAEYDKALLDYEGAQRLKNDGFQSRSQIASALASLKSAEARLDQAKADVARLDIKAPFDGVLQARLIEVGDFIQRGKPCARILSLNPIVVSGYLSEEDISKVEVGNRASVNISGIPEVLTGVVRYLSNSAEEATRAYRVELSLPNPEFSIKDGLTAELSIEGRRMRAHIVPSSILSLLEGNRVGIRTLNQNDEVVMHPVTILEDHEHGIWVAGLPDHARLIVAGQEYVNVGDKVSYVEVESKHKVSSIHNTVKSEQ